MLISEERYIWWIWYWFMHSLINNKMIWNNFLGYRRYKNDRCLIYGIAFFDIWKETWFCVASVGACCIPWYSILTYYINYINSWRFIVILLDTLPLSISATGPNSASNLVASSFIIEIRKKCLGGYKMDIAVSPVKGRIEGFRSRRNSLTT